jgi:hypothetical protein
MIKLKIHNDGKEKLESFEAWIEGIDCEKGYGATKLEAIEEYKRELKRFSMRVTAAMQDMELEDYEAVNVDRSGKEI